MNKIITIGREFGSGGREFGRRLAEQLGYAYYDQEIIREIANRTALSEKYVQQIVEHRPVTSFPIHTGRSFMMMYDPLMEQNQSIFRGQCEILQQMAEKSDCVIVGRGADNIMRDRHPLRIVIYSGIYSKIQRCRKKVHQILRVDQDRAHYYEYYTGQTWGARESYDLCLNTTNIEIKQAVSMVAKMFG